MQGKNSKKNYLVVHEWWRGWRRHERVLSVHLLHRCLLSDGHLQLEVVGRVVVVFESEGLHGACPSERAAGCELRTELILDREPSRRLSPEVQAASPLAAIGCRSPRPLLQRRTLPVLGGGGARSLARRFAQFAQIIS
jgi:hypothetical protein